MAQKEPAADVMEAGVTGLVAEARHGPFHIRAALRWKPLAPAWTPLRPADFK